MDWHVAGRCLPIGTRTLVMGVLNVTPDSFSDGAEFSSTDAALKQGEMMIEEGADIIDVGGESTRPGAVPVPLEEEINRVAPVIEELAHRTDIPISVDTTKSPVASVALSAGAVIVNDISGLRFDHRLADKVAKSGAGLVLMHSRGTPAELHKLPPVADIMHEVIHGLRSSIALAQLRGVKREQIVVDPGIGFGKSQEQNIELIVRLNEIAAAFPELPVLIGTSRKSFIGRLLADEDGTPAPVSERLHGTTATLTAAILRGADIVRAHDVRAAVETARVADAIRAAAIQRPAPR